MPSCQLTFRVTCGTFLPVYINFMKKRAVLKAAMRASVLTPRTKLDGVFLGLTLSFLFWGGLLLLRSGDVERHPGPPAPPPEKDNSGTLKAMLTSTRRDTRSRVGSASADRAQATTSSSSTRDPPQEEPSRAELMDVLQNVLSTMN